MPVAATSSQAYWYLTRSTGAVALVLLSATVVLGVLGPMRVSLGKRWPRFALASVHRDVSLLVLVFLVIHVVTAVLDSFAPITLLDAVVPFIGTYRPIWLGLGALAFDLLIALVITSLLRRRLGLARWRAVHWLAYLSWPIAVVHGLGTGSDIRQPWMQWLTVACGGMVVLAVLLRITRAPEVGAGRKGRWSMVTAAVPIGVGVFALVGPLQSGWARRAGTPAALLHATRTAALTTAGTTSATAARPGELTQRVRSFSVALGGRERRRRAVGGSVVDLTLRLSGATAGSLRVRLAGAPAPGGGLASLVGSQVDLASPQLGEVFAGKVVQLTGDTLRAQTTDATGRELDLTAALRIDHADGTVTGELTGRPGRVR